MMDLPRLLPRTRPAKRLAKRLQISAAGRFFGCLSGAVVILVLGSNAMIAQESPTQPPEPGIYRGRQIAHVMSYRGAPWLERDNRDAEEDTGALLKRMALVPGQTVADLGCGSGYYSRRMAEMVGPTGTVFAVDVQPEMLDLLRENAQQAGLDNIVAVQGRDDDPFLPDGEMDWLLLVDVYHELQQPDAVLARMLESLAPGGRIALAEYRLDGTSAAHIKTEHRMSIDQVRKEWEPAGFELEEVWEELPTQHLFIFKRAGDA